VIDQVRSDLAKLAGLPKGERNDIEYNLSRAREAAEKGDQPRLLEKLNPVRDILTALGGSVLGAHALAEAVGTLANRAASVGL